MTRVLSVSTTFSLFLLSSTVFSGPSAPPSVTLADELNRPHSPIHIVYHDGEEKVAVRHKSIIGANKLYQQNITGKGTKVIVIEGIFDPTHSDYENNLTVSTLANANASEGFWHDWVVHPMTKYYFGGHAAHVTGTVGGKNGIAPGADLRVIDYGKEAWIPNKEVVIAARQSLAKALEIAAQTTGHVVNLSQALEHKSLHSVQGIAEEVRNAMIKVAQSGKIIVMAAGNERLALGDDAYTESLTALAASPEMKGRLILVGATDYPRLKERLGKYSDKAGRAKNHYIVAPGSDIDGPNSYNRRALLSGTSMATPMVSGALALLREAAPNLQPEDYTDLLFRSARKESINQSTIFSHDTYGHGVLNIKAAINLAIQEGKAKPFKKATSSLPKVEKIQYTTPKTSQHIFLEKIKTVGTRLGQTLSSAAQSAYRTVKNGLSYFFSW